MPESYIEPLTDRQQCFKCHKTVTGKKKLSKCGKCHAITYCGKECQVADFARHKWNCVPVMVTEIPGKGRGLVAARDIKMGELIFIDEPVIKINSDVDGLVDNMDLVIEQVDNLPSEAKLQFESLKVPGKDDKVCKKGCCKKEETLLTFEKFAANMGRSTVDGEQYFYLHLNVPLMNHSCAPNVVECCLQPEEECKVEVRAIKDIFKGDEITKCYFHTMEFWKVGFDAQKRKKGIQDRFKFDCKCSVCSGIVPGQEDVMMALYGLHATIDLNAYKKKKTDWKRDAETTKRIVELKKTIFVGSGVFSKAKSLSDWAKMAQLGRDEDLLKNAMATYSKLVEDIKLEHIRLDFEKLENDLAKWTIQLKSKKNPQKEEVDFFFNVK